MELQTDLCSRIYRLESDLLAALRRINQLEVEVLALTEVTLPVVQNHLAVTEEKTEIIGSSLQELIADLTEEQPRRRVRIVRRMTHQIRTRDTASSSKEEEITSST